MSIQKDFWIRDDKFTRHEYVRVKKFGRHTHKVVGFYNKKGQYEIKKEFPDLRELLYKQTFGSVRYKSDVMRVNSLMKEYPYLLRQAFYCKLTAKNLFKINPKLYYELHGIDINSERVQRVLAAFAKGRILYSE